MGTKIKGDERLSYGPEKACAKSADDSVDAVLAEMKALNFDFGSRPEQWNEKTWHVIKMRLQFPAATNTELAKRLNVTREWVRRVLTRAKLPTRAQSEYCELVCAGCGIIFEKKKTEVERRRAKGQTLFYHDNKCLYEDFRQRIENRFKLKWDHEAVYKLRREKDWGAVRISRELGIPKKTVELILRKVNLTHKLPKWDHAAVRRLRIEKGWGCVRISRELGIPIGTVEYILKKGNLSHKLPKRDHEAVYRLRRDRGWGAVRIGKELSIPISTVSFILRKGKQCRLIT